MASYEETQIQHNLLIYRTVFSLFNFQSVQNAEENDVFVGVFEDAFLTEMASLKVKVESHHSSSLLSLFNKIKLGLNELLVGNFNGSNEYFNTALQSANDILLSQSDFHCKALAARFAILFLCYSSEYFLLPVVEGRSTELLETQCTQIFSKLLNDPMVITALHDETNASFLQSFTNNAKKRNERFQILQELTSLNSFFFSILGRRLPMDIFTKRGEKTGKVHTAQDFKARVVATSSGKTKIICMTVANGKIFCGDMSGSIIEFDTVTLQQERVLSKVHYSEVRSITVRNNKLYSMSLITVKVHDLQTFTAVKGDINTLSGIQYLYVSDTHAFTCHDGTRIQLYALAGMVQVKDEFLTANHGLKLFELCVYKNILYLTHPEVDSTVTNSVVMYDMTTCSELGTQLRGHSSEVRNMRALQDRLYCATSTSLFVWDLLTHSLLAEISHSGCYGMTLYRKTLFCYNGSGDVLELDTRNLAGLFSGATATPFSPMFRIEPKENDFCGNIAVTNDVICSLIGSKVYVKLL